jgi:hypothetical protein
MGPARVPATESFPARLIRYVHLLEEELPAGKPFPLIDSRIPNVFKLLCNIQNDGSILSTKDNMLKGWNRRHMLFQSCQPRTRVIHSNVPLQPSPHHRHAPPDAANLAETPNSQKPVRHRSSRHFPQSSDPPPYLARWRGCRATV